MTMQAPTSRASFDNPATAEERARIIREQRTVNTRSAMTSVLEPSAGGRFAKALGEYTVGATPTVEYPPLPDGSPWRQQQPPPEEPFGVDIGYVEVCGTDAEIARAAAILEHSAAASSPPQGQSDADPLPPLLPGSANSAPLTEPPAVGGADPTLGSSAGLSSSSDRPTSAPPPDAASAPREGANRAELRRGGAALSWRRFG
jgi:hypothetical protein